VDSDVASDRALPISTTPSCQGRIEA
jgi:hypothetical protein